MTSPTGHQDLVNFSGWKYYMLMRVCCQHHCWKNMVLSIWIHWERVNRNKYFPYPEPYKSESEVALMCPTLCDPGPTRFFHPWDSPGKNTGVGCHFLRKGTFLTQGLNPGLSHCRRILYLLNQQGSPRILEWVAYPFSRGIFQPRNQTGVSCIAGGLFTSWATREAHGCKSWTIKKAEHQIIYGFELWCWRRLLRVP